MKIKTWLLLSFLIVMILPLASAYFLFASAMKFHQDAKVEEYYEVYEKIQPIKEILHDGDLYDAETSKDQLNEWTSDQLAIKLYNKDGYTLYSSKAYSEHLVTKRDVLYKDLYELQEGLRAYIYKEPVLENGNVVGFYEITIAREAFVETIANRALFIATLFIFSFIVIYVVIAIVVHHRVNKRLTGLMDEMSAFARGYTYQETVTGNDEIGELKKHFYYMRHQITDAQAAIKTEQKDKEYMVATISHDLKTPLTSIKAYAEALKYREHLTNEEREQYRQVIMEKSDFMKQMLDDLMTHTLLQSKTYELDMVTVDGEEFFDMIISDYEPLCEEKQLTLTTENSVIGDYDVSPKQLMRVADNLMMNAIQHTPQDGNVWIGTFSNEDNIPSWLFDYVQTSYSFDTNEHMYLVVQNEGIGIDEANKRYLFNPLYQVDQARSKKEAHGTGLGLSISQIIIGKHSGTIDVCSQINQGACFICAIPKKREVQHE